MIGVADLMEVLGCSGCCDTWLAGMTLTELVGELLITLAVACILHLGFVSKIKDDR